MKVYFNYTKNLLDHPDEKTRTNLIEKIKEGLLESYKKDLDNKITRMKDLNLIGMFKIDKFGDEWLECIKNYEDGRFISVVALCGIIAEKITYGLIEETEIKINNSSVSLKQKAGFLRLNQAERIGLLEEFKIISHEISGKLNQIRDKRNNYLHPNRRSPINPEKDSKDMLNLLEDILKSLYKLVPVSGQLTNITQPLKLDREKVK